MLIYNIFDVFCLTIHPARPLHGSHPGLNLLRDNLLLYGVLILIILKTLHFLDSLFMSVAARDLLQVHWHHRVVLVGQCVEPSKQGVAYFPVAVVIRRMMVLMPTMTIFVDYILSKKWLR